MIAEYIDAGAGHIHIAGEPGIGKTTTLRQVTTEFQHEYDIEIRNIRPNHNLNDIFRGVNHVLFNHFPDDLTEEGRSLSGISISPLGGVSWDADDPDATRAQFGHRDALRKLAELFPDDQSLLICVDDVHELSDEDRAIRGTINETADILPQNVVLITAGRLTFPNSDTAVSLDTFTEDQTALLLRNAFLDIDETRIQTIHDQVAGHPLYLGLLIEANDSSESLELPEHEVYTVIEERYLQFLSPDERRVLRATALLRELNEAVCTHVLPDSYDLDRVAVADILDSLSTRTVVQNIGRNHDGLATFKIHDVFRSFLHDLWDRTAETEQRAFEYYAESTIELTSDDHSLETEVSSITSCLKYLSDSVIQTEEDTLSDLVEHVFADDGLSFYPASLLATELKTRDVAQLPDTVIESVLASVAERQSIANDFYDDRLHISWAERQLDHGAFDPSIPVQRSYLGRITDTYPGFVRRVIKETTINDEKTQQYLIRISTELPAADATVVGEQAVQWLHKTEAYHSLVGQVLELITHLCAEREFDTALALLDTVLTPQQTGDRNQLDGDQSMTRYRLIQTLKEIFDELLAERGAAFIDLLKTNLEAALHEGMDTVDRTGIVRHSVVTDLDYADENRGTLQQLLLEYFTRAAMQWVSADPTATGRRELVDELLAGSITFRRVAFAVLAAHPESYRDMVETVLTDTDNYRELPVGYEFYCLLTAGFKHLDNEGQEQVCKIISDGPYTDYDRRAEQIAEREAEPASYFKQRLQEKWQRDRFLLIRDELPAHYVNQLTALLDTYGEPEQLPSQPYQPDVSGGFVNQRGPEQTEKLRDQPAEGVLTRAAEWEPPETERWETDDTGQLEEWNHLGFSRQLRELIEEQPERYARKISILEDANTRYAEAAFRAFRELLDDGQPFPWHSIIELATAITDDPTAWSSGCRTNLAKLLNKGIAAEETDFPQNHDKDVHKILLTLLDDPDPSHERDQPADGMAGHRDPIQVAINTVRPMALNAFITYTRWTEQDEDDSNSALLDAIEARITDDQSLAVRTVIGRRFITLWTLNQNRIADCLENIFPRGDTPTEHRRFIAAWNSYVRHNTIWEGYAPLRPYYIHAMLLLDTEEADPYELNVRSTAAHIASSYLFGDEQLTDDTSLIRQYYSSASSGDAAELATTLANAIDTPNVAEQWPAIRALWEWRLDQLEDTAAIASQEHANEIRQFLDCVRTVSVADLSQEQDNICRSLPFLVKGNRNIHWRWIEEWLANQSAIHPTVTVDLYQNFVNEVSDEDWSSIVWTSQAENRERIYENADAVNDTTLQTAMHVANQFAAEGCDLDREFLDMHL
ncbi:hypothetical protein E2L06_17625 [Haloterrigena sp. H1]|uniref:ATP-binding protein n=1 Tax=Haloterrigena sp. H1 TaxID=2552943 RepID=UPI00110E59EE|nr:ATP-binding protein [Haloterrigena sp. H1]TMT81731.1 hypothetical protein E2L06_17625 [Haloterrigena sp. H1]